MNDSNAAKVLASGYTGDVVMSDTHVLFSPVDEAELD
jgi:hypothetical protein